MKRLGRSLRLVVVALLALLAAGTGLAQDAAGMWPEHDPEEIDRLVQSAEGGDAEAQLHLALMYACGFGGMEQSATEALIWFRRSANRDSPTRKARWETRTRSGNWPASNKTMPKPPGGAGWPPNRETPTANGAWPSCTATAPASIRTSRSP